MYWRESGDPIRITIQGWRFNILWLNILFHRPVFTLEMCVLPVSVDVVTFEWKNQTAKYRFQHCHLAVGGFKHYHESSHVNLIKIDALLRIDTVSQKKYCKPQVYQYFLASLQKMKKKGQWLLPRERQTSTIFFVIPQYCQWRFPYLIGYADDQYLWLNSTWVFLSFEMITVS